MYLDGLPYVRLGSLQDRIRISTWYRAKQPDIFNCLINVYANAMAVNPDITKKVQSLIEDFLELMIPGSKKLKDQEEDTFIKKQQAALEQISARLKGGPATWGTPKQ